MELCITRPMVFSDDGGMRTFVPNLTVEVDAATAEQILAQHAGIAVAQSDAIATPRRKKSTDAEA